MQTGRAGALLSLLIAATAVACFGQAAPPRPECRRPEGPCYFASFENAGEAAQWRAVGQASAAPSPDFPSWQTHSLRVGVPRGASGGVETRHVPKAFHRYEALQFFVYAAQPGELTVHLGDAPVRVGLKRGSNHVQIRLKDLRNVDRGAIETLRLTAGGENALYFDRFALAEHNETLAAFGRMDAPYGMDIETPHVKWAQPYANGPLNVLIVPDVAHGRAAVELAQRLQCALFPVSLGERSGTNRWGFGDFYGERGDSYGAPFTLAYTYLADQLLNGPRYDVMILPGTRPWDEFPAVVRETIRKRVEQGMGLVLLDVNATDPAKAADLFELSPLRPLERGRIAKSWEAAPGEYITRNVPLAFPFEQMPYVRSAASGQVLIKTDTGDPILAVKRVGKGRVVAAAWEQRGLIPMVQSQFRASTSWHYWEYMYSLLARSAVWAAAKESPAAIQAIEFDDAAGPRRVTVRASGAADATVEITVLNEHWVQERSARLKAAPAAVFELPAAPNGRLHFVNVILRGKDGKIADWGAARYTTAQPAIIAGITFSADRFPAGAPVTGEFEVQGGGPGLTLRASLFDNCGRLLAERAQPLAAGAARVPFSLSSGGALSRVVWVEGRIERNGVERHRLRRDVFVLQPRKWDDYDVVMYLFGSDPAPGLWNALQKRLGEMYVTTLSSYPLELSKYANFGVQAQTRISGLESPDGAAREPYLEQKRKFFSTGDKQYLARLHCLSDPAFLKQQEEEMAKLVKPWVPFSPMSYYIYEEPSLTCYEDAWDVCFSPHCLRRMRDWLRKEYGSLEAVNREWGTRFNRWEEVVPDTSEEAQKRDNYASWADHRTFMEEVYAGNYGYVRELLHRHDPDGLVLLSGTQESSPHNGTDYYQIDQVVGHLNPYRVGNQLEFHRSFNPRLRSSGGTGYGAHGREAAYNLYSDLYHGFWAGAYIFWQYSILNPDYQFCGSAKDIQRVLRELQDEGVARLIGSASRDNMRIAMHYSYPSIRGTWIPDGKVTRPEQNPDTNPGPTGTKFVDNRDGWINVVKDLGFQFDMLARQQIEAGELASRDFRVLILPFSVAITDREAAQIRKFVEGGGILIADGQPGVMNGHCRWLERGSLDDLFGIERTAPARHKELAGSAPESAIRSVGGKALATLDGAPAVIVRDHGKGKAIYLNFFLNSYVEDRRNGGDAKWKKLVTQALDAGSVKPAYRVLTAGGAPLPGFELVAFSSGPAKFVGVLKNNEVELRTAPMTVELDRAYHVYDVRNKKYLGSTRTVQDSIQTGEPKLYALLPAPVSRVTAKLAGQASRGARVNYDASVDAAPGSKAVLLVRVYKPDGSLAREYSENLEATGGKAVSGFHLALNDPPGEWKLVATEAVSGRSSSLSFRVE